MSEDIIQRSPEWFAARLGKVTASKVSDLIAKTKSGYAASRANYMAQLLCERLTQTPTVTYQNDAMRWGTEKEPEARTAYAFWRDAEVTEVGFILHPSIEMSGASPDGHIDDDGMLEIKCPGTATHLETLLGSTIEGKYITQMQWQMACARRQWCDFVSFDPRLPPSMQLFTKRIHRDEVRIHELEFEVKAFLSELADKEARLKATYGQ